MHRRIYSYLIVFLFWLACLFQIAWGNREDYPFSFFGMYRGISVGNSYRIDIEFGNKDQVPKDFYRCLDDSRYVLNNQLFSQILNRKRSIDKETLKQVDPLNGENITLNRSQLKKILSPYFHDVLKDKLCPKFKGSFVTIKLKAWKDLHPGNYSSPDYSRAVATFSPEEIHD